jgi:hemerythrin-like metal-binding protein
MNPQKLSNAKVGDRTGAWSSRTQSWPTLWKLHESGELETGIPELDRDHRNLVSLIGQLNAAIIWHMGVDKVRDAMQALIDNAATRFACEVSLLSLSSYPDVEQHAQRHAETLASLCKIMRGLGRDTPEHRWVEAGLRVKRVLIDHLLEEDTKYRDYFRNLRSPQTSGTSTQ